MATPIFWTCSPKNHWNNFQLTWICTSMQKISSFHPFILDWDTVNFRVQWPDWPHPFLTILNQKIFDQFFNLCEFVSTCKKPGYFIDLFWKYDWLNLIGWENFGPYLKNKKFSQIWDLCRNTAKNIYFHYRTY